MCQVHTNCDLGMATAVLCIGKELLFSRPHFQVDGGGGQQHRPLVFASITSSLCPRLSTTHVARCGPPPWAARCWQGRALRAPALGDAVRKCHPNLQRPATAREQRGLEDDFQSELPRVHRAGIFFLF